MGVSAGVLARGPWEPGHVDVAWREEPFEAPGEAIDAADLALDELRRRGSPSHDGFAARMVDFSTTHDGLSLVLQPVRWALRLIPEGAARSLSTQCTVRSADGRWLAGRRAQWLATWAGRWALGAAGSVEVDENPVETMRRELREEWSVEPERMCAEALVLLPNGAVMLLGQAWLADGATVTPDDEHDEFAWWPADPASWPDEAHEALRRTAALIAS